MTVFFRTVVKLKSNQMNNKTLTVAIISGLLIIGIAGCYLKDCETILKYPENNTKIFISSDSITIAPYFYVEDFNTLGAVVDFESLKDSLFLVELCVSVSSTDNPNQSIKLKYVSTVVHPVKINGGDYLDQLKVDSFKDLSHHDKTITNGGCPYNKITFFFKTWQIKNTHFYTFKIKGRILYKGQTLDFEEDIKTRRVVEYRPYRMMT